MRWMGVAARFALVPWLVAVEPGRAASAPESFVPNRLPVLQVGRGAGRIDIDGDLGDPGWVGAARAGNFSEVNPGDQTKPPVDTEVLVTYDDTNFYLAFLADDGDPGAIRASFRDRDEIFQDDNVGIILDTYGTAAWAYEISANPLGIQGDVRWTPSGEDVRFDIVFASAGKVTARGYQVEMAIPFSSLRFPEVPEQKWRATFWRTHPRDSRRQYSWAAVDRDDPCWPCQYGTLVGIGAVRGGTRFELLPAVVGSQFGALRDASDLGSGLDQSKPSADLGLGLRYSINSSMTADATFHPDFSQVESDAAQVNVNTTFALFFPERRPFFQEGSDLFKTYVQAVYTRSINDPRVAAKLTGTLGRTSVAYIGGRDEHSPLILPFEERSDFARGGPSTTNVLRLKQNILEDSFLGALVTDRRLDGGGAGTVLGGDGSVRFRKNYRFNWQALASRTVEPRDTALTADVGQKTFDGGKHTAAFDGESYWGHALYSRFVRDARLWNVELTYQETSPTFRADNGFVTQNDNRSIEGWTGLFFRPNNRFMDQFTPNIDVGRMWNTRGRRKDEWLRPQISLQLKGQTSLGVSYLASRERFRDRDFSGIHRWEMDLNSNFSDPVHAGLWLSRGRFIARNLDVPVLGRGFNFEAWGTLKPLPRLIVEPGYTYAELSYPDGGPKIFSSYILRTRLAYQFTRELFLRLVLQYNGFADELQVDPLLTYKVNPFTVFYLGSTHEYQKHRLQDGSDDLTQTSRQFFLKLQYLFRM